MRTVEAILIKEGEIRSRLRWTICKERQRADMRKWAPKGTAEQCRRQDKSQVVQKIRHLGLSRSNNLRERKELDCQSVTAVRKNFFFFSVLRVG